MAISKFNHCRRHAIKILCIATLSFIVVHILSSSETCSDDSNCSYNGFKVHNPTIIQKSTTKYGNHPWSLIEADNLPPLSSNYVSDALKPRRAFKSYDEYIQFQLKKTMNPKLRKLWTSKDWKRKVDMFSQVFKNFINQGLLKPSHKALCIAARVGQEVLALREVGITDSIGIDLVASPPLVIKGDMHKLPFSANTFDFEFSNAFDHSLLPSVFASEVERTLKPGGIVVLHVAITTPTDKYSANDLLSIKPLIALFKNSDVVHVKNVDVFGLDTEVVLRKRHRTHQSVSSSNNHMIITKPTCSIPKARRDAIKNAEPLIMEESKKPWITLKQNAKNIKYLPNLIDIRRYKRYIYVDVGARSYGSSIGSWFVRQYPKQNQHFSIYAIEADKSFAKEYMKHKDVHFMGYAAWIKNESLVFGANPENRAVEGEIGMGRIQTRLHSRDGIVVDDGGNGSQFQTVMGLDLAEWVQRTASKDDYVVMKMDIEGAEFDVLPRMIETGAICLVDELFLECHYNRWQRTSSQRTSKYKNTYSQCLSLFKNLRRNGVLVHQWW